MHALSPRDILRVWGLAEGRHAIDRALALLDAGYPDMSWDELAGLSIGRRDSLLLDLYGRTFGSDLTGSIECSECTERLEVTLSVADLMGRSGREDGGDVIELATGELQLRFRLPTSQDLAAVAGCDDVASGRRLLLERCLLEASRDGTPVAAKELPPEAMEEMSAHMNERDHLAEVLLDVECPACGHGWQASFDIASFVWARVSTEARLLTSEVHSLAQAYGWAETDILSMSGARRQLYLEMVSG